MSSHQPKIDPALLRNLEEVIASVGKDSPADKQNQLQLYLDFFKTGLTYNLKPKDKMPESENRSAVQTLQNKRSENTRSQATPAASARPKPKKPVSKKKSTTAGNNKKSTAGNNNKSE